MGLFYMASPPGGDAKSRSRHGHTPSFVARMNASGMGSILAFSDSAADLTAAARASPASSIRVLSPTASPSSRGGSSSHAFSWDRASELGGSGSGVRSGLADARGGKSAASSTGALSEMASLSLGAGVRAGVSQSVRGTGGRKLGGGDANNASSPGASGNGVGPGKSRLGTSFRESVPMDGSMRTCCVHAKQLGELLTGGVQAKGPGDIIVAAMRAAEARRQAEAASASASAGTAAAAAAWSAPS